jgi:hypothetical protein
LCKLQTELLNSLNGDLQFEHTQIYMIQQWKILIFTNNSTYIDNTKMTRWERRMLRSKYKFLGYIVADVVVVCVK